MSERPAPFGDPVALVRAAVVAEEREDWTTLLDCADAASVGLFRHHVLRSLAYTPTPPDPESYARSDATMPRAVAEWMIADEVARNASRLAEELPGVVTLDEARALSPRAFVERWLAARGMPRAVARAREEGRIDEAQAAALLADHRARVAEHVPTVEVGPPFMLSPAVAYVPFRFARSGEPAAVDPEWAAERARELASYTPAERALAEDGGAGTWWVQSRLVCRQPDGTWRLLLDPTTMSNRSAWIQVEPRGDEA